MKIKSYLLIVTIILVGLGGLVFFSTEKVKAQNQFASDLVERLAHDNLPVRSVSVLSRVPYVVEIGLQSTSDTEKLTMDDNWNMQLARREATFSYRRGARLSNFKLKVFNQQGINIYSEQGFLYADDLNQNIDTQRSKIDNQAAKDIVAQALSFGTLGVDVLDVLSEGADGFGQILIIQLSADTLQAANQALPEFLNSFFGMQETINRDSGMNLVLIHLRVVDLKQNILLDYVRDLESGMTQWFGTPGLSGEFYPQNKMQSWVDPTPTLPSEPYPPPP